MIQNSIPIIVCQIKQRISRLWLCRSRKGLMHGATGLVDFTKTLCCFCIGEKQKRGISHFNTRNETFWRKTHFDYFRTEKGRFDELLAMVGPPIMHIKIIGFQFPIVSQDIDVIFLSLWFLSLGSYKCLYSWTWLIKVSISSSFKSILHNTSLKSWTEFNSIFLYHASGFRDVGSL